MEKRKFILKSDLIILLILGLIAIAAFVFFNRGEETGYAEIVYENEVIERLDLSKDGIYSPTGLMLPLR